MTMSCGIFLKTG
jgi:hypothetical protein